jgi:predicted Zn finger-like uncharacterized protein
MRIVCPHCTTSYAVKLETFGTAGRTVRCSRCKEVWLARPEDAVDAAAPLPAMAAAGPASAESDAADEWEAIARQEEAETTPVVESPSISADWPTGDEASRDQADWPAVAREDLESHADTTSQRPGRLRRLIPPFPRPHLHLPAATLPTACAAMAALAIALVVWRADVVRLLPQTALFYKMAGLEVNLRGLTFKDIKVSNETVDGKPVLVIEGVIVGETRKPIELPRLRFSVRDAQGAEIYAWNAVLEQPVLKPGERAFFKSRLASPPAEGRNIDIRFFNKRDLAGGHA